MCKECLWVLSCTASNRAFWCKSTITEFFNEFRFNQRTNIFHIHLFDLMVFVRCTETIKEVDERYRCFKCCQVRNRRKIHYFLNRTRTEHCEACLAASHNILMITEDTQ